MLLFFFLSFFSFTANNQMQGVGKCYDNVQMDFEDLYFKKVV